MTYLCIECRRLGWTCDANSRAGAGHEPAVCVRHPNVLMLPAEEVFRKLEAEDALRRIECRKRNS